jgi:hypothetical protein
MAGILIINICPSVEATHLLRVSVRFGESDWSLILMSSFEEVVDKGNGKSAHEHDNGPVHGRSVDWSRIRPEAPEECCPGIGYSAGVDEDAVFS